MPKKKTTKTTRAKRAPKQPKERSAADLAALLKDIVRDRQARGLLGKDAKVGQVRPYSSDRRFSYGDRVAHPNFGTGVVQLIKAKKMEVAFSDRTRVLIHAAA